MSTASKITTLNKLSCAIFGNIYNPNGLRTGNKILRERLVGPTINSYYPNVKQIKLREITRMVPEMNLIDQSEKVRLEDLSEKKKRGKGPPKKGKAWGGLCAKPVQEIMKDLFYPNKHTHDRPLFANNTFFF